MSDAPIEVLASARLTAEQLAMLRAAHPRLLIHGEPGGIALAPPTPALAAEPAYPTWRPEIDVDALLQRCEVLIASRIPPDLLTRAPRLRWLQFTSAGVDHVWQPALSSSDLLITTIRGTHPGPMAEYVLSVILLFAKQWPRLLRQQQQARWEKFLLEEVAGRTMCVVGLGAIGQAVARLCAAVGMSVVGVRRHPDRARPDSVVARVYGPDGLSQALGQAHFVVACLPLTPETQGWIDETAFRAMRSDAVFINVGRGRTVDQTALTRALREGWIAGAGLDVFAEEPLPENDPLWRLPNVVISPHIGADTPRYMERAAAIIADNLRRYAEGLPLRNLVDRTLRY